jgi:hypothetical protein
MREEIIATIPQADGEAMLEVALMHDGAGRAMVELRSLVWGSGLGWYRQQTLTVDGTTASNLLCRLSSVRHRLRTKSDRRQRNERDNILPFARRRPQHTDMEPHRTVPMRERERIKARAVSRQG